jgi:sorbitol-6-phosphate 2-dehydrogenase
MSINITGEGKTLHSVLAPLVRGLGIGAAKQPLAVVPGAAAAGTFTAELGPAIKDGLLDEGSAAAILNTAFSDWLKTNGGPVSDGGKSGSNSNDASVSGAAAALPEKIPSCTNITLNGETIAVYWTGFDLEAARTRRDKADASPLSLSAFQNEALCTPGASAQRRADVVKNRICLVTGGAQGFGEEIVRGLAASGALVYAADLNLKGAEALAQRINETAKRSAVIAVGVDVTNEDSVRNMFNTVAETSGGLDLCVSNAGVLQAGSVMEQELKSFKFTTDVNYVGYFIIAKHASRLLRLQHRTAGSYWTDLIEINSKSGLEGSNKNGAYAGGKFGGLGLTESFALELVEYNIKVNAICPGNFLNGPLWSDPVKGLFVQYLNAGKVKGAKTVADVRAYYEGKVPIGRGCSGPDVMRAIYYIVEQEYETGQAVPVTGGQKKLH